MSSNVREILSRLITPELIVQSSQIIGETEGAVTRGLGGAVTSLLHGLEDRSTDNGAMSYIADLANAVTREPAGLDDVKGLLSGGIPGSTAALAGNRLLGLLFGAEQSSLVDLIVQFSGLRPASAASLLSLAAPKVLEAIGQRLGGGALTGSALAGLIVQERQSLLGLFAPAGAVASRASGAVRPDAPALIGAAGAPAAHAGDRHVGSRVFTWLLLFSVPLSIAGALYWQSLQNSAGRNVPVAQPAEAVAKAPAAPAPAPAAVSVPLATPPAASAALPEGMARIALAGGSEIEAAANGVETKLIEFITDSSAEIDKGKWFDFDRLNFETGSTALTTDSKSQVANIVAILKAFPAVQVKIGGYTDNLGNRSSNLVLSDKRALVVRNAIIAAGIDRDRVEAEGYGDKHPIADNATEAGRAKNRRTAISVRAK